MYRSFFCFDDSLHLTLFCIGFQQMDIHVGCQVFPPMIQVPTWHRLYCYLYPLCFALRLKISFKLKKHFRKEGNKIVLGLPGYCQYTLTRGGGTFMPSKQCVNGMCLSCASLRDQGYLLGGIYGRWQRGLGTGPSPGHQGPCNQIPASD